LGRVRSLKIADLSMITFCNIGRGRFDDQPPNYMRKPCAMPTWKKAAPATL